MYFMAMCTSFDNCYSFVDLENLLWQLFGVLLFEFSVNSRYQFSVITIANSISLIFYKLFLTLLTASFAIQNIFNVT